MPTERTSARTVGIVIRTLNESELIGRCLETLAAQRGDFDLDVLVVDSGSTDATVEIARAHGARITTLAPGDFDYSKALNLGIEQVRGDLVVSLSAHAIPVDDDWLERMTAHFDRSAGGRRLHAVRCRGRRRRGRRCIASQQAFGERSRAPTRNGDAAAVVFSNAASAIRRSVVERAAVHAAGGRGHRLGAASRLRRLVDRLRARRPVYHSHHEDPRAQAQRLIDINRVSDGARTRRRTLREGAGFFGAMRGRSSGSTSRSVASCPTSASSSARSGTTSSTSRGAGRQLSGGARTPASPSPYE